MDINNQSSQELLSAYLDDALTAVELAQVESWLATDATAVNYLNELRSNRQTLKALAGLPDIGLKTSLADRVLAQTAELDSASANSNKVRLPAPIEQPNSHSWRIWATLAATAAALGCMVAMPFMQTPTKPLGFVPEVSLPANSPETTEVASNQPTELPRAELPGTVTEPSADVIPSETPEGKIVGNSRKMPDERPDPNSPALVQMMLIVDVVMSEGAWDSAKFDEMITKNGVRYEKEVVASPKLIEEFIKSPLDAGADADSTVRSPAAVVYVDCPLKTMSGLLLEIEQDTDNFPEFDVKMAIIGGPLGRGDHQQLLRLLREQSISIGRGVAKLVVPESADKELAKLLPVYEAPVRKTPPALRNGVSARLAGDYSKMAIGNLDGELLFVLRKQ